jgi:hypothetical protein
VANATVGEAANGGPACHLVVRREPGKARRHAQGAHAVAPTHLDAGASSAACETPVQYAFDYSDPAASACIERHLEHALAVGADGTWLDNMGPNLYGAMTGTGVLLGSYDLRYPLQSNPEPCPRELENADLEGPENLVGEAQRERETAIYKFKLCRFSAMVKSQSSRVANAVAAIHKILGRKPLVFGNGLKHSFYWTGKEASLVRAQYREYMLRVNGVAIAEDDPRPFAPNASESVIYYRVRGTRETMSSHNGALDGFNMESFYGFIQVKHQCANWPIGTLPNGRPVGLEACGAQLDHPATNFWHANVRVFANAGQRGLRALAKVGQAGWKTVGQEYLPPAELHRWVMGAYASFLFTVSKNNALSLGVHPFAQLETPNGTRVMPWLHPVFFLDVGLPMRTETLVESYRVSGHEAYSRRFERAIVLYNPSDKVDSDIPLGDEFIDPWDAGCAPRTTYTLRGQSGAVLMQISADSGLGRRRMRRRRRRRRV